MQALGAVTLKIGDDLTVTLASMEVSRELGGNDHLIPNAALPHPLANPLFRLLELVVARRVDKIATLAIEIVKDAFSSWLVTITHYTCLSTAIERSTDQLGNVSYSL